MTTLIDVLRYESGIAGEEAADLIESLEKQNDILLDERDAITKDRDECRAENAKLRELVALIFASTLPYNDGEPTFSDKVTDMWAELTPNANWATPPNADAGNA